MSDRYRLLQAQASTLKLRAGALVAAVEQSITFALDLYRRAAALEAEALAELPSPDAETRLASLVEQCGLHLLAGDQELVLTRLWPDVLALAATLPAEVAEALLERLRPAVLAIETERPGRSDP